MLGKRLRRATSSTQTIQSLRREEAEFMASLRPAVIGLGLVATAADVVLPFRLVLETDSSTAERCGVQGRSRTNQALA